VTSDFRPVIRLRTLDPSRNINVRRVRLVGHQESDGHRPGHGTRDRDAGRCRGACPGIGVLNRVGIIRADQVDSGCVGVTCLAVECDLHREQRTGRGIGAVEYLGVA